MNWNAPSACAFGAAAVMFTANAANAGSPVFEDTVNTFGILKRGNYVQVDAVTVGTQSYDFFAGFTEQPSPAHNVLTADFKYTNMDSIPNSVGIAETSPGAWAWDDPTMYGNEAALSFTYTPANDYIFRLHVDGLGAFEESIDGPTDLYPDAIPRVNNYAALQSADVTSDVPVTFSGFGSVGALNTVALRIEPSGSNAVAFSTQGANTDTMLTIPGGALAPNMTYDMFLIYETFQNYNDRTTIFPDALAAYTFRYETRVTFSTVPTPGAITIAALAIYPFTRRRR